MPVEANMEAGTPGSFAGVWNSDRKVNVIAVDPKWYRAAINTVIQLADFKIYYFYRKGTDFCVKTTHPDVGGKKSVVWLDVTD